MSNTINYLTKESLDSIKSELNDLRTKGRANIAKAIAEAREKGDLKENAEYDAAKEAQGMHEAKIAQLENVIANARILDASTLDLSKVSILTNVKVINLKTNKEVIYKIVSEKEADLKLNKISVSSPMGKSLLGKSVNDIAHVQTPTVVLEFKILEISI